MEVVNMVINVIIIRPMEISSKRAVGRHRDVVQLPAEVFVFYLFGILFKNLT